MGKNVKWKYEPYAFYNKQGIEERLSAMAAEGWFIEKMGMFWKYRKGEPTERTYNVVYVEEAAHEADELRQLELVDYCAAAGWKRCFAKKGMLIFYHEGENPVPIETDTEFAVKNIHKAMKEVYLQRYLSFCILAAGYLFKLWSEWQYSPLNVLTSSGTLFLVAYILMAVVSLIDAGIYYKWRRKALNAIADGDDILPAGENIVQRCIADWSIYVVLFIGLGSLFGENSYGWIIFTAAMLAVFYLVYKIDERRRNEGFEDVPTRKKAKIEIKQPWGFLLVMAIGLILCLFIVGIAYFGTLHMPKDGNHETQAAVTLEAFHEIEEDETSDSYYYEHESLLLKDVSYDQCVESVVGQEYMTVEHYFEYRYIKVKIHGIYDLAFEKYLEQERKNLSTFDELDGTKFGVKKIYQRDGEYLVLWDDAFAKIDFGWELSDEELTFTLTKLREAHN